MPRTSVSESPRSCAICASLKPCSFAMRRVVGIQLAGRADELGDLVDQDDLVEEPRVDAGRLEQLLDRGALAQRLLDDDDAAVGRASSRSR